MKSKNLIHIINSTNGESELVKYLFIAWHQKWFFVTCFIAIFSVCFWYFAYHTHYSATARFSANSLKQEILNRNGLNVQVNEDANKIISNFFSDPVIDTIRKKFYSSSKKLQDPLAIAKVKSSIGKNISIKKVQFDDYELTVKAPDRFRCADIANEIVSQVQQISIREEQRLLEQRIEMIKHLAHNAKDTLSQSNMEKLVTEISDEFKKLNSSDRESPTLQKLQTQISNISDSLKGENDALNRMRLANEVILQVVSENNFPTVASIQKALPDYQNYVWENIGYSLFIAMALVVLMPWLIYFFQKSRYDWKEIAMIDERAEKVAKVPIIVKS